MGLVTIYGKFMKYNRDRLILTFKKNTDPFSAEPLRNKDLISCAFKMSISVGT